MEHRTKVSREEQLKNKANFESEEGKLFIVQCVACNQENWALAVASGCCAWCGWEENNKLIKE